MDDEMLFDCHDDICSDDMLIEPCWSPDASQNPSSTELTGWDTPSQVDASPEVQLDPRLAPFDPHPQGLSVCSRDVYSTLVPGRREAHSSLTGYSADKLMHTHASYRAASDGHSRHSALTPSQGESDRDRVITAIEAIFSDVNQSLLEQDVLYIALSSRTQRYRAHSFTIGHPERSKPPRTYKFPGDTPEEAWRFTVILRILDQIHEALIQHTVVTKRDIYYKAPALYGKQAVVDKYVDDIACTFGVPRFALNVSAASKGIAAGAFTILDPTDGTMEDGLSDGVCSSYPLRNAEAQHRQGMLIRTLAFDETVHMAKAEFVLVVEKEASFRALLGSTFWHNHRHRAVMITAKGYPDVATRAFLHLLMTPSSRNGFCCPPGYCLVDYDPDGLSIFLTYKNGSVALAHENEHLTVPPLQRIGLKSSVAFDAELVDDVLNTDGLLRLSLRDRRMATRMLQRQRDQIDCDVDVCQDLLTMLMLNIKCEIQVCEALTGGLSKWLTDSLNESCDRQLSVRYGSLYRAN